MLISREYKPIENELIYHYCSSDTFYSICTNKTIRLSDLFSMNDFLEIHWGYSIWEKAASEIIKDVGEDFLDKIDYIISSTGIRTSILASCFSLEADVLSQWRAYSNDGSGYCVGFNAKDIIQLPVRPLMVLYDEKKQIKETVSILKAIYEVENSAEQTDKYGSGFFDACATLAVDLAAFKNSAFREEKEIRLLHLLNFEPSNKYLKLVDNGGTSFGGKTKGEKVNFRMAENLPVPYIDINFTNNNKISPIKEVYIGPKNNSRETAVSVFLETLNIGNVEIKKSKASYR
ncbi:DUF2971 domain-containing protein [Flavobacteriaceae bacterium F89]|uniref:DUF2971 domain-containing protein n=1 Tax=Cerina litoralis TaxID=2874477 RepID=A0AAE3EZ21_9FLAO|nr:DUF2971 domain-containing protein [Cerina litoralis]MCG2462804.1 DUF2971 domain-containing protein [Cerina litoralis]